MAGLLELAGYEAREAIEQTAGEHRRREGWLALAADGSRFELPRTAEHQACGSDGSERDDLRAMLPHTPSGCLLVADAGFTGYDLLREIVKSDRYVLLRVGATPSCCRIGCRMKLRPMARRCGCGRAAPASAAPPLPNNPTPQC